MQFFKNAIVFLTACLFVSVPLMAHMGEDHEHIVNVADSKLGKILTDSKGMTLYVFTADKDGKSTCYDQCAKAWPPFLVTSQQPHFNTNIEGKFGLMARKDNKQQVTYNNMPLYYYQKDKKPGDVTGQGVDGAWFVVQPKSK